jgi:hypothetical protein
MLFFNAMFYWVVNPRTSKTSLKAATPLEEVCRKKRKHPEEEPDNSPFNVCSGNSSLYYD